MLIVNSVVCGYGDNHNLNFSVCPCDFFFVLNPDIRLQDKNLMSLLDHFQSERVGIVAPQIINSDGYLEDSARAFPTLISIAKRYLFSYNSIANSKQGVENIDWFAGMFMVFSSSTFTRIGGFDTRYFMYLEDADICLRIRKILNKDLIYDNSVTCIHDARRASRSLLNKAFYWHVASLIKFQIRYILFKFFWNK